MGRGSYVLERALEDARAETMRLRARASCNARAGLDASGLGRFAELQYAAREGFAVWSCVPRWLRAAIHGSAASPYGPSTVSSVTTRDRGVDVVGLRDGRLVLVQVKWYREGACVCGDASMKLALIAAEAQRALKLDEPPRAILVMRRGARTTRSSPGTAGIEYACLSDEDLGLLRGPDFLPSVGDFIPSVGPDGLHGAHGLDGARGLDGAHGPDGAYCPFEAYRYRLKNTESMKLK